MKNKYQEALELNFEETYIMDLHLEKYPEAQEALYENKEFKEYIDKTEEFSNKYNQATADALQELVDKEIPKKPYKNYGNIGNCPMCQQQIHAFYDYCCWCGQKLDWSEKNEK